MTKRRVVIQAGHISPREPNFEGGTGTIREQEFTRKMRDTLVKLLEEDGRFVPIPIPGDVPNGIVCDAFISEHGDGAVNSSASGFCFGYPNYAINKQLADLISDEYLLIPGHPPKKKDNYTRNLSGYYGFGLVNTPGPEVLVESGFLTNPKEQRWLFSNINNLALAQYKALLKYFKLPLPKTEDGWKIGDPLWENLPGPQPKPKWFWDALKEYERRRSLVN